VPPWTPSRGAAALAEEFGPEEAVQLLTTILRGEETPAPLFLRVMTHIGNIHTATIEGPQGWSSWFEFPETWAARGLGYLEADDGIPALIEAASHPHWRVRRTALRSLGWFAGPEALDAIIAARQDPDHRVRAQSPVSEVKVLARLK
jgi:HEAT repeat protein